MKVVALYKQDYMVIYSSVAWLPFTEDRFQPLQRLLVMSAKMSATLRGRNSL